MPLPGHLRVLLCPLRHGQRPALGVEPGLLQKVKEAAVNCRDVQEADDHHHPSHTNRRLPGGLFRQQSQKGICVYCFVLYATDNAIYYPYTMLACSLVPMACRLDTLAEEEFGKYCAHWSGGEDAFRSGGGLNGGRGPLCTQDTGAPWPERRWR